MSQKIGIELFLTVPEAAERTGYTRVALAMLAKRLRIQAVIDPRTGHYLIPLSTIPDLQRRRERKRGRPKKTEFPDYEG